MKRIVKTIAYIAFILSISCTLVFGAEETQREGIARRVKKLQADLEIFKKVASNDDLVCISEHAQKKYHLNQVETLGKLESKIKRYLMYNDDIGYWKIIWPIMEKSDVIKKEIREKTIPGIETKLELIQLALYSARENGGRQDQETETNDGDESEEPPTSHSSSDGGVCPLKKPAYDGDYHDIPQNHEGVEPFTQCFYYPSGAIKREVSFKSGQRDGADIGYFDEPQHRIREIHKFKNGSVVGTSTVWAIDKNTGHRFRFYEEVRRDNKLVSKTQWFSNGKENNHTYYYSNGKKSEFRQWDSEGKLIMCVDVDHFGKGTDCLP